MNHAARPANPAAAAEHEARAAAAAARGHDNDARTERARAEHALGRRADGHTELPVPRCCNRPSHA